MAEALRENPDEALVVVFTSEQESEAMVVQGLLESAGIDVMATNFDAPQDVLPGVGGVALRVREEHAAEAKDIIGEYRSKGLAENEVEEEEESA